MWRATVAASRPSSARRRRSGAPCWYCRRRSLRGERFLLGHAGARLAVALRDRGELGFERAAALRKLEERALRLAHRLAARAQLVGRLAARFLRRGELGLQLLDAPAQLAQVLLARRRGFRRGARRAASADREEEDSPPRHAPRARGRHRGYFAFPWLATECCAFATASASPR